MAATFTKIATVTVGSGGAANIEFTSIPATYSDICVKISVRSDRAVYYTSFISLTFNGSTSSYSWRNVSGQGGSALSQSGSGTPNLVAYTSQSTSTSNTFGSTEIYIPNYAGSNYKSISSDSVMENNDATNYYLGLFTSLWSNTAAITSLKLELTDGGSNYYNFLQYSTATLYGIKSS